MRKKKHDSKHHGSSGFEHLASNADFYAGAHSERPLYEDRPQSDVNRVRKTSRHQAAAGSRKETVDPREKMALIAILKAVIAILLLMIAFLLLWKGIAFYEEKVWMDNQPVPEVSPVMKENAIVDDFDISSGGAKETFAGRIDVWTRSETILRTVDDLLLRNNIDLAIERCQDILKLDPAHAKALERLGQLYFEKGMFAEAMNAYIRLLSVDPTRTDLQLALLKSLDAYGDPEATVSVADWYQERNTYNADVQRYMANAYFKQEKYAEAASAYDRVLKDAAHNVEALENQSISYMRLEQYDKALATLKKLVLINYRDPMCYKRIAICYAQIGKGEETVQTLGKSAHLFGPDTVIMWIQDPMMDPIRADRGFQAFTDQVGGEEFRKYLERMAKTMETEKPKEIVPQLELPERANIDAELLKPK